MIRSGFQLWLLKIEINWTEFIQFFDFVIGFPYLFSQHVLCVFTFIIRLYFVFYNMLTYILWLSIGLLVCYWTGLQTCSHFFFNNVFMSLNPCTKKIWRNKSHIKVYTKEVIVSLQLIVLHCDLYYIVANKRAFKCKFIFPDLWCCVKILHGKTVARRNIFSINGNTFLTFNNYNYLKRKKSISGWAMCDILARG